MMLLMTLSLAAGQGTAAGPPSEIDVNLEKQHGKATITTDEMTVTIEGRGNVPKFSFYANIDNETRFHVHFIKIVEFNDTNGDGMYNESEHQANTPVLGLASVSWVLSDAVEDGNLISFNFTSDEIAYGEGPTPYANLEIVLAVHFDTSNGAAFKFDILMENWPFEDTNNMLALRFDITWCAEDNGSISIDKEDDGAYLVQNGEDIAYFAYEDTAQVVNSTDVDVNIAYDDKMGNSEFEHGIKAFLSYPNFNGSQLIHDPTLGVIVDTSSGTAGTSVGDTMVLPFPTISKAGFLAITVVSTAVLAIVFFARRRSA